MSDDFTELLKEQMRNPKFREAYNDLEPDYDIIRFLVDTELSTQEIAEKTGFSRNTIFKIQMADANPSLKTLKQIAKSFGQKLRIRFEPA